MVSHQRFTEQWMVQTGAEVVSNLGAGDSYLLLNVLPEELSRRAFSECHQEVDWQQMFHKGNPVPREVCLQGSVEDSSIPLYRHPVDEHPTLHPWTPCVNEIREHLQERIDQHLNHALIQHYRSGRDNISEHSDKTLDINRGTVIVNLSLGATRVLQLRTKSKDGERVQQVYLPHNSLFVLGWETNRTWRHAIVPDGRSLSKRSSVVQREGGHRISLTFRDIATFYRLTDGLLFGQGARSKTLAEAVRSKQPVTVARRHRDALAMVRAFSVENKSPNFDWDRSYARGFNVLDFKGLQEIEALPTDVIPDSVERSLVSEKIWASLASDPKSAMSASKPDTETSSVTGSPSAPKRSWADLLKASNTIKASSPTKRKAHEEFSQSMRYPKVQPIASPPSNQRSYASVLSK